MKTSNRGFLLVTVLLVLFVVLSLGAVLLGKSSNDSRFVQHEISTISLKNNQLFHSIKRVSFKFEFPRTLEITLQGDHFSLQTEISNVKFSPEGTR